MSQSQKDIEEDAATKADPSPTRKPQLQLDDKRNNLVMLGAGTYWAMHLLLVCGAGGGSLQNGMVPTTSATLFAFVLKYVLTLALVCVFVLAAKKSSGIHTQKALAWCMVGGLGTCLLFTATPLSSLAPSSTVASLGSTLGNLCTLLLWGLCFTSLDRHEAERTSLGALAVALAVYLLILLFPLGAVATECIAYLLVIIAVIPILTDRLVITPERREGPANKKVLKPFYGSRFFYGACHGAIGYLCASAVIADAERSRILMLAVLVLLLAFMWRQKRANASNLTGLRLSPILACGIIACPLLGTCSIEVAVLTCTQTSVWMAWSILHSVQLSTIKNSTGLDDCTLAFSEKGTFILAYATTTTVLSLITPLTTFLASNPDVVVAAVVVIGFAAVMTSCYQLSRVIDMKETERIVGDTLAVREQRNEPVYEKIAADYGLTPRELEVFRLSAKGRTRPAICEELCISEGTYRTHIYRIYKKLDVHSHDELLELVDKEMQKYVAR